MLMWLWRRIRFSVPGQLVWESVARAKRFFDASVAGHYFYKLPTLVRALIIVLPVLALIAGSVGIYYAYQTTEATGRIDSYRPGSPFTLMEGSILTPLDDVQLEFRPSVAKDEAGMVSYLHPVDPNQSYAVEFRKDPRGERVDKILVRLKRGTRLRVANNVAGTIAKEGEKPKRFQIHLMGE
jgi:hypothetical protein